MEKVLERLATLEAVVFGKTAKDGLIARLDHLHTCVESLKPTIWKAVGAGAGAMFVAELLVKRFGG